MESEYEAGFVRICRLFAGQTGENSESTHNLLKGRLWVLFFTLTESRTSFFTQTPIAGMVDGLVQEEDFYQQFYHTATYGLENHMELLETAFTLYVNACRKKGVVFKRRVVAGFDLLGGVLRDSGLGNVGG